MSPEALYGWMLRKSVHGWRKGRWSRRFFVLAPRSRLLLYFSHGLNSRQVQMSRDADPGAPAARGVVQLVDAVVDDAIVEEEKPYSFVIRVPGAEYYLSARSLDLKEKWITQIRAIANAEPIDEPQEEPLEEPLRPASVPVTKPPVDDPRLSLRPPLPMRPPPPPPPPPPKDGPPGDEKEPTELDFLASFFTGEAAEEHSECAVCFDELNERPVGVLLNATGDRLCRHIFHYDCLDDLDTKLCPMCREEAASIVELPNVLENPREWFRLLDVDRTGRIESEDVLVTLKAQLRVREDVLDTQWDKLWDRFDLDHSGSLTYDELLDPDRGLLVAVKAALREATGSSGTIPPAAPEPPELPPQLRPEDTALLMEQHPGPPPAGPPPMMMMMGPDLTKDKSGWFDFWDEDGSGSLDEGELLRALVHSFQKRGQRKAVREMREIVHSLLAACDVSGDGVISRDEFLATNTGLADVIIANFGFFTPPQQPVQEPAPPVVPSEQPQDLLRLEIRTNGGLRYSPSNVTSTTTVGQLRAMAASFHTDALEASHARLVHKGNVLRDDSATLDSSGVRDGDSIVLIVGSSVSRLSTAAPPSYDSIRHQCRVTVPANAGPGSVLTIRAPHARELRVTVPPNHFPGSTFTVDYDADSGPPPPPRSPPPRYFAACCCH